jgi:hypothetical protein
LDRPSTMAQERSIKSGAPACPRPSTKIGKHLLLWLYPHNVLLCSTLDQLAGI